VYPLAEECLDIVRRKFDAQNPTGYEVCADVVAASDDDDELSAPPKDKAWQ